MVGDYNLIMDCNKNGVKKIYHSMDMMQVLLLLLLLKLEKECLIHLLQMHKMLEEMLV